MVKVVSTGVSHLCDNSTVSVKDLQQAIPFDLKWVGL